MNKLSLEKRVRILNLLVECSSMRSISRSHDVSFNTVKKLLRDAGQVCKDYHDTKVRGLECEHVQCDEIWTFCYAKDKNVPYAISPPPYAGSQWTWTALDVASRLLLTFEVGDRTYETAHSFTQDLASRIVGQVQITTDGHKPYIDAVKGSFGARADYSQLVKMFGGKPKFRHLPDGSLEPIGGSVFGQTVRVIFGAPTRDLVGTSYVERHNLTMRMGMKRFTRRSNAFSRTLEYHILHQHLYMLHYNFIRIHDSLGTTPAVAAGVTKKVRDMAWLVRKIDKAAPKPNRPKRYNKRNKEIVNG